MIQVIFWTRVFEENRTSPTLILVLGLPVGRLRHWLLIGLCDTSRWDYNLYCIVIIVCTSMMQCLSVLRGLESVITESITLLDTSVETIPITPPQWLESCESSRPYDESDRAFQLYREFMRIARREQRGAVARQCKPLWYTCGRWCQTKTLFTHSKRQPFALPACRKAADCRSRCVNVFGKENSVTWSLYFFFFLTSKRSSLTDWFYNDVDFQSFFFILIIFWVVNSVQKLPVPLSFRYCTYLVL